MQVKLKTMLVLAILLFAGVACSSGNTNIHRQEAAAVCDVFNPKHWQTQDMEPAELQTLLSERIKAATQTEEMRAILQSLPSMPHSKRYNIYTTEVSKLTGQAYRCPGIKDYLSI